MTTIQQASVEATIANNAMPPWDAVHVLEALRACSHVDPSIREPAERALKAWESSPAPGYLTALLSIVGNVSELTVSQDVRLLAAILVKNSIPHIWQQQQQDQNRCNENPQELARSNERAMVRSTLPNLLFSEPSDRIALQLRLAVASVGLFDFPRQWPNLLRDLSALVADHQADVVRIRAIKTLRDVLQSLQHCKIVLKTNGVRTLVEVQALANQALQQRLETFEAASLQLLTALTKGAFDHATGLAQASSNGNWVLEGKLCVGYFKAIVELLPMSAVLQKKMQEHQSFLASTLQTLFQQLSILLDQTKLLYHTTATCPVPNAAQEWTRLVNKVHQAVVRCCTVAVRTMPVQFAPIVDSTVRSVLDSILKEDAQTLPRKRLLWHIRFLATVLHSRAYHASGATTTKESAVLQSAQQALETTIFHKDMCDGIVETLVTKYLKLTDANVMEYSDDPEEWFQIKDAERTSVEPETPSRCGEIVLVSMMDRNPDCVGQTLLELARRYQMQTTDSVVGLLHREACYHALEICHHWMSSSKNNKGGQPLLVFGNWWNAELRILLQASLGPTEAVPVRALQARAVQVVNAYRASLGDDEFDVAFQALVNLLVTPDLVTGLQAAKCLTHFTISSLTISNSEEPPRLVAVRKHSISALSNAFALAKRVSSEECLSAVLKLVSSLIEANGASLEHCLDAIAEQLPPLWERAGDGTSLHSSLIAVLNHLIIKIGYTAVEHVHVQQVLFPLVDYCTDIAVAHRADTLLEEGLKLWLVTLATSRMAVMGPALTAMLPRLEAILRSGLEPHLSLKVLRLYALVMGVPQIVEPLADVVSALLVQCTSCTQSPALDKDKENNEMEEDNDPPYMAESQSHHMGSAKKSSTSATLEDGVAAVNFMEALMHLHPTLGYSISLPALSKLVTTISQKRLPLPLAEGVFRALCRLLWIQPLALEEMFVGNADQAKTHVTKLVMTWLQLVSISSLASMLDPRVGKLTFIKRKAAALSLCSAVCHSPNVAQWIGPAVVHYTEKLVEAQVDNSKLTTEQLVEAACAATTQQVPGDGPLGDVATRAKEMTKDDPFLTTNLKDALESARNALNSVSGSLFA